MNSKHIFFLFCGAKLLDLAVLFLAPLFIPYLGFFPYRETAVQFGLPAVLTPLANFDGVHYLLIAIDGYAQYEQAFFPLFPLAIHILGKLFSENYFLAGLLITNVSFLIGLFLFNKLLVCLIEDKKKIVWMLLFLVFFPTSFFFTAVYTESLFFLLLSGAFYYFVQKKYGIVVLFAYLASLTRTTGVFLSVAFYSFHIFSSLQNNHVSLIKAIMLPKCLWVLLISSIGGFLTYAMYLWITVGDPLFFFHAQPAFGANRSTSLILLPQALFRYIKIFLTSEKNFQYFISVVEFGLFLFVFCSILWFVYTLLRKGHYKQQAILGSLALFSLINLLLPTLTGTLSSVPRYALMSLVVFIAMGSIQSRFIKGIMLFVSLLLHIVLFSFFVQGYFIS